jgi:hypothetical protein
MYLQRYDYISLDMGNNEDLWPGSKKKGAKTLILRRLDTFSHLN